MTLVEIHSPSWYSTAICPCCDQSSLEFITCPTCGLIVLICNEIGEIYAISGRRCGPLVGQFGKNDTCGGCGMGSYDDFPNSTSDEIRALGFTYPDDYC